MALTTDASPTVPPSLDELIEAAKEVAGAIYSCLTRPIDDLTPFVLVASRRDNDLATAHFPEVDDDVTEALADTRWLPALLLHHQATACVLVLGASTPADENEFEAGSDATTPRPRRGFEHLYLSAHGQDRDVFEFADVKRPAGKPPRLGAWHEAPFPSPLEKCVKAVHAALGRYELDAASPAPEVDAPFGVEFDGDTSRLLEAAQIPARVFNGPGGQKAVVVRDHRDSEAAANVLLAAGAEVADLSTEDRLYLVTEVAYSAPLEELGVADDEVRTPSEMALLFDETNQPRLPAPARVGRNKPCPCGSGTKFKRCCGR